MPQSSAPPFAPFDRLRAEPSDRLGADAVLKRFGRQAGLDFFDPTWCGEAYPLLPKGEIRDFWFPPLWDRNAWRRRRFNAVSARSGRLRSNGRARTHRDPSDRVARRNAPGLCRRSAPWLLGGREPTPGAWANVVWALRAWLGLMLVVAHGRGARTAWPWAWL